MKHKEQTQTIAILCKDLVVLDFDTMDLYHHFQERFPSDFDPTTIIQEQTRSGMHVFYKRPPSFDTHHIYDKARAFPSIPLDIKTVCSTGTRGVVVITPSPNKQWILAPWQASLKEPSPALEAWILENYQHNPHSSHTPQNQNNTSNTKALTNSTSSSHPLNPPKDNEEHVERSLGQTQITQILNDCIKHYHPQRAADYSTWSAIAFALLNIGKRYKLDTTDYLHTFSRQCESKYDPHKVNEWIQTNQPRLRDQGYGLRYMLHCLKEDDREVYDIMYEQMFEPKVNEPKVNEETQIDVDVVSNQTFIGKPYIVKPGIVEVPKAVTEKEVAYSFSKYVQGRFIWDHKGKLYNWNGYYWRVCNAEEEKPFYEELRCELVLKWSSLVKEMVKKRYESLDKTSDSYANDKKAIDKFISSMSKLDSVTTAGNIIKQTRLTLRLSTDSKWNECVEYIQFENALLDVVNHRFIQPDPNLYINRCNGVKLLNLSGEELEEAKRKVRDFITDISSNEGNARFLLKFCAARMYLGNREEIALFLTGSGGNGKGSLVAIIEKSFGNEFGILNMAYYTSESRTGAEVNLYETMGCRIVMSSESCVMSKFLDGKFKAITGNDTIKCRTNYARKEEKFTMGGVMIQTNNLPKFVGNNIDDALVRRIRVLPFPHKYVNRTPIPETNEKRANIMLKEWLKSDQAVTAFWHILMEYWPIYQSEGLEMTKEMRIATREYLNEIDEVSAWLRANLKKCSKSVISQRAILQRYNDVAEYKFNDKGFTKKLRSLGYDPVNSKYGYKLHGYKLLTPLIDDKNKKVEEDKEDKCKEEVGKEKVEEGEGQDNEEDDNEEDDNDEDDNEEEKKSDE
jgi:phage/plasmid-associated DNA primase